MENALTDRSLFGSRVIDRMKSALGVSMDKEVAEYFGINQASVTNWRKRGTIPVEQCIQLTLEKGVSLDWLLLGLGTDSQVSPDVAVSFRDPDYTEIPLYDVEASAGHGRMFDEERIVSYLKFRNDWLSREGLHKKDLVAIRVRGDSMDGTLHDGDTVLIDRSRRKPDGVFAIRIGEVLRVKRLQQMTDGSLRISSDNEIYAPEVIHKENLDQVEIIGFCHWRGGRVF